MSSSNETLTCSTCVTPWHISCMAIAVQLSSSNVWECLDFSDLAPVGAPVAREKSELMAEVHALGDYDIGYSNSSVNRVNVYQQTYQAKNEDKQSGRLGAMSVSLP
ncbi:hypothetical protein AgCh_021629 [Apium graveolens]